MNSSRSVHTDELAVASARSATGAAKARLLQWADAHDVQAKHHRSGLSSVVGRGAAVLTAGFILHKLMGLGKRKRPESTAGKAGGQLLNWTLAASVGRLALRYALQHSRTR